MVIVMICNLIEKVQAKKKIVTHVPTCLLSTVHPKTFAAVDEDFEEGGGVIVSTSCYKNLYHVT